MELHESPVSDKELGRKSYPIQLREEIEALDKITVASCDLQWLKKKIFLSLDKMKKIMKGAGQG